MKEMKDCLEKHRVSLAGPCVIHRFLSCISGEKKNLQENSIAHQLVKAE